MKYTTKTHIRTIPADRLGDYRDIEKFMPSCESCPSYGTRYSCPPFDFDTEEYLSSHKFAHFVLTQVFYHEDTIEYTRNSPERQSEVLFKSRMEVFDMIEGLKVGKEKDGGVSIACYSCNDCKNCKRKTGEECHSLHKMRYAIAGFGFDITKIAGELFGISLLWQNETIPEYQCLVGMFLDDNEEFSLGVEEK